jgi:hypothetical protein
MTKIFPKKTDPINNNLPQPAPTMGKAAGGKVERKGGEAGGAPRRILEIGEMSR